MSTVIIKKVLFVGCIGVVAGYFASVVFSPKIQKSFTGRGPASLALLAKHARLMDLDVYGNLDSGEIGNFFADVSVLRPSSSQMFYKWILPEGAQVLEGEASGVISGIDARSHHKLNLSVKNFKGGQIFLRVYQLQSDGTEIGETRPFTPLASTITADHSDALDGADGSGAAEKNATTN